MPGWRLSAAAVLFLAGLGCTAHYGNATREVLALAERGQPREGLSLLRKTAEDIELDPLLLKLDEGALLRQAGESAASANALNDAIALADARETVSFSQELFGKAPYRAATYEKQALHVLQALNYLSLGQLDEAVVEARLTDARHLRTVRERDANQERFVTGVALSDPQRDYLERLVVGRYLSALAYELAGNADSAFLDYLDAYRIAYRSPQGAPAAAPYLVPSLLRRARQLERVEEAELVRQNPSAKPEEVPDGQGELVVLLEVGLVPRRSVGQKDVSLELVYRDRSPLRITVGGQTQLAQTLTSLEDVMVRRGHVGLLLDSERAPSIAANTTLCFSTLLLPPIGVPLLLHRVVESTTRREQSWKLLPAELAVARFWLPPGEHELSVDSARQKVRVEVGKVTLVSLRARTAAGVVTGEGTTTSGSP